LLKRDSGKPCIYDENLKALDGPFTHPSGISDGPSGDSNGPKIEHP
jgi:hypothetical protein